MKPGYDVADREFRLGMTHHLTTVAGADSAVTAAQDLVGLHATDPMTVYLSAWARVPAFQAAHLDRSPL